MYAIPPFPSMQFDGLSDVRGIEAVSWAATYKRSVTQLSRYWPTATTDRNRSTLALILTPTRISYQILRLR